MEKRIASRQQSPDFYREHGETKSGGSYTTILLAVGRCDTEVEARFTIM